VYPGVFKHYPGIVHFECIAHPRRYVLEAVKAGERAALPLLKEIARLYRIERQATDQQMNAAQRGALRYAKAKPILKRLQRQFRALERDVPLFCRNRDMPARRR
jgi:transposase IS66 family protein